MSPQEKLQEPAGAGEAIAPFDVPVPVAVRPLAAINPRAASEAFVAVLGILYHAERAAMEAFGRLGDPNVVEKCEIFISAQPALMADEESHARDLETLIGALGGRGIPPPTEGFDDLWDVERSRCKLVFPLRARVAALFAFMAESLGYACLYQLAQATQDAEARVGVLLNSNVEDEERHIRISVDVLRQALAAPGGLASLDLALHFCAFFLMSRKAGRTMVANLGAAGLDPYVMAGSSLHFTCGILRTVVEQSSGRSIGFRFLSLLMQLAAWPRAVRVFAAAAYLPEPPFFWPAFRAASRVIGRRDSRPAPRAS